MIDRIRSKSLFILGVQKAGTTSLHDLLAQHPAIAAASPKEPNHYIKIASQGPMVLASGAIEMDALPYFEAEDYAATFGEPDEDARYFLDSSTGYFPYDEALDAIASHCTEPRIIVVLREPVSRAYSAYNWARKVGWEPLASFEEALAKEDLRISEGYWFSYWYRRHSEYADRIAAVKARFRHVHIVDFDDLRRDSQAVCDEIFSWLDLPERSVEALKSNQSGLDASPLRRILRHLATRRRSDQGTICGLIRRLVPRSWLTLVKRRLIRNLDEKTVAPPALDPELRKAMGAQFAPDIRDLEALLGRSFAHWKQL